MSYRFRMRRAVVLSGTLVIAAGVAYASRAAENYESVPVTLTVKLVLTNLHPRAREAGLICAAKGGSVNAVTSDYNAIDQAVLSLDPTIQARAYDIFSARLLSPAHYVGSETSIQFPLDKRGYSGAHVVTLNIPSRSFVDPSTHILVTAPAVVMGCWLTINGTPAQQSRGTELVSTSNVNHVAGNPIMVIMEGGVKSQ